MKRFTDLHSFNALNKHAQALCEQSHHNRHSIVTKMPQSTLENSHISLDFSHQQFNENTIELLIDLANERQLKARINGLINGDHVNQSENRPALHTALRCPDETPIFVDNHNIIPDVLATREQMQSIASKIRAGLWPGYTGLPITSIVNIGMGGSDLGPRFCVNALAEWRAPHLSYHFVSDMDPGSFDASVATLNPETTLFIVSSKSFTTEETLHNARKAFAWVGNPRGAHQHFIAVTANQTKAQRFGITHILPIWEWVGGRYSLCSAINLITCIAIGYERFSDLLEGAHSMDKHFNQRDFHENMPVIMALAGIWNINFLHISNLLLLIYAKQLEQFVPYLQQLDMESNGKSIDVQGERVNYATGPIVWGGLGNQAQHSYYQLLCQGTHQIAADFISTSLSQNETINALCDTKIRILSKGIPATHSPAFIAGGMPINHIRLTTCTPFCIGALVALYEHKLFTQSVIWNINPFDQPGVESVKRFKSLPMRENA